MSMPTSRSGRRPVITSLIDVRTTPSALNFARQLLQCARRDMDASKVLIREGLNPLAVFHLQQAIEKSMKAELLIFGLYAEDEVKRFGHNSFMAFNDFWRKIEATQVSPGVVSRGTKEQDELIDLMKKDPMPMLRLGYEQISEIMAIVDKNANLWYANLRSHLPQEKVSDYEMVGHYATFYGLMAMAAISYLHEGCTRYPDMDPTPDEYTENLGIVKATPELLERLDFIVGFLEQLALE